MTCGGGAQVETMLQTGTTGLAMMIGTPHFMSPEQFALGVKVTPQTDLWSLAVTMYQALSGGLPFAAGEADRNRISHAIVNTPSLRLSDAAGCAVPESLSDCVAKAMQKDLAQRYHTAADMATAMRLATELPSRWAAMDGAANCTQVPILREADADLWSRVEARVAESLPDFALVGMERVQNKALWRKYSTYCAGQEVVDERELFHYAPPEALDKILSSSSVSFDPRLGGGEYGAGAYFAQHAVYSVAFSAGWLSDDAETDAQGRVVRVVRNQSIERERAADPTVTLIWARVALGHCKDFGARCRSDRGNAAADAAGVGRHLNDEDDWGAAIGRGGASGYHRPPPRGVTELYDSVSGTEGDLAWAQHPRLRDDGAKLGRQYITFDTNQAYPELVLRLERRPEVTRRFAYAAEQEALGKDDKEMAHGTTVYVQGFAGLGVVCPGYTRNMLSANSHSLRFADGERSLNLREHSWHVVGDESAALALFFESDPEAFWARVGEGCGGAALAAVREACAARPTEAGGDCELGLAYKRLGDAPYTAGRALASLPRPMPYTRISLSGNGLGPAGVRSVARGLQLGYGGGGGGRGLEELYLSANPFGGDAEAVGALAAALPPTLKELNLYKVGLGDAGLGALLPSLRALPALEVLDFRSNELGAEGFGAVGAALPSWGALRMLGLSLNRRAGSAGVRALAAALPGAPPSLATLEVLDCGAESAAVAELRRAGARIGNLRTVDLYA
eukprot:COSAG01_NODE_3425_length_6110_cov_36.342871_4_plen_737_part_00